jgi:hypothetical protein
LSTCTTRFYQEIDVSHKYFRCRAAIRPGIAALWLVLIGAVLCAPARADAAPAGTEPVLSCASLASPDLVTPEGKTVRFDKIPDALTRILKASEVDAKGEVPAYCSASGYIANSIGIEIHMPLHGWNGKFALVGCGGMCGFIQQEACNTAVTRGYSCIFSDMGHHSTQVDAEWASNNLQGLMDFAYRSTHLAAVVGKAMTAAFYGQQPALSYYMGCSTGGRQGYMEAQRYPEDFNGILAGAPPMSETGNALSIVWAMKSLNQADGTPLMTPDTLSMVHRAALDACDNLDGVKDGVIGNMAACHFDPHVLICKSDATSHCLTAIQADAIEKVYHGPTDSKGRSIYGGFLPGTELLWITNYLNDPSKGGKPVISKYIGFMNSVLRYLAFYPSAGPGFSVDQLDWDKDPDRMRTTSALMDPQNPDLHAFRDAGGKFIAYHGLSDWLVPPMPSIAYDEALTREMGGKEATQAFFRLFLEPGVYHCQGGDGAYASDMLSALEDWVEHGHAPDQIIIAKPRDPKTGFSPHFYGQSPDAMKDPSMSRPLFPYPSVTVYSGHGDTADAANFVPR